MEKQLRSRVALRSGVGSIWQGQTVCPSPSGLIRAHPIHPGWECLPLKSNQSAKLSAKSSPTPSCSAGDGKGCVPGRIAPICGERGVGVGWEDLHISLLLRNAALLLALSLSLAGVGLIDS